MQTKLPAHFLVVAALALALSAAESIFDIAQPILMVATVVILVAEALKVLFILHRFRISESGNVMGSVILAEGVSFAVDAAFVCIVAFPYSAPKMVSVFSVCAIFLAARLSGSIALSQLLSK